MEDIRWQYNYGFKPKKKKMLVKYKSIHDDNGDTHQKIIYYYDSICTFDIETATITDAKRPYAFMYIWQFCFDNEHVYMGRTWKDFRELIHNLKHDLHLSDTRRLIVYIHNASYEFQFVKDFLAISDVFEMGPHKVLTFTAEGIEFRCSYLLTNMSLAKLCKNTPTCVHNKLSGKEFDYKIRLPDTPLTALELQYCYNDVKGLAECLEYRLQEDNLVTIPKTSTGYVRRDMRNAMRKNKENYRSFQECRLDPFLYRMCRLAFRGGDTHSNPTHTNVIVPNVKCVDIKSSYPASLLMNSYPIGPFVEENPNEYMSNFEARQKGSCALITVIYEDIEYIGADNMPYISASKCFELTDCIYDNGRVRYASYLMITVTDIDYRIMEATYHYKEATVTKVWSAPKGKLPKEFRDTVIDYFRKKSLLDGDPDRKYEYSKAKSRLNATYGMTVTRYDRAMSEWIEGEMVPQNKPLEDILNKYYESKNNFLSYQWGVWCTAWSRFRLKLALIEIVKGDAVYCDTDSIFYVGDHEAEFEALNNRLREAAFKAGAYAPDKNNNLLYMGLFEHDKSFKQFMTLGAKKYIGILDSGEWYCTIAGVSKEAGAEYFKKVGFSKFREGEVIPESGHLVAYYNESGRHYINYKGCRILTGSNIALVDQDYTINITTDYKKLLEDQANGIYHLF